MSPIKFTNTEKSLLIDKLQSYFIKELDQELGQFDADFLLDFFTEELGAVYYNRGLYDAQALMAEKIELISEQIVELELPVS
ncbi:DUF2164 domain-containing protein [Cognaticolwellia beringensis]|uniref:DUF2164 domain-containing protein n=1 Tax=Cognaticolwellia beringensis TaxID=1967665 RepID=A0A222GAJ0_9GAMM|nr:DUF2164 domain-containing protein [Cognaticolwellia beringensis]ASP48394.1 DUF2164 domain-containing protein [Cognaticolwellia beringensis]|tara:strand:- start:1349 stop:1594 length:246 start_codon:yes stop_codon:yes gene_type:complete